MKVVNLTGFTVFRTENAPNVFCLSYTTIYFWFRILFFISIDSLNHVYFNNFEGLAWNLLCCSKLQRK
jgi:hypothetical protein